MKVDEDVAELQYRGCMYAIMACALLALALWGTL